MTPDEQLKFIAQKINTDFAQDRSCLQCTHFNDKEECVLYKQRPPAKIIAMGALHTTSYHFE